MKVVVLGAGFGGLELTATLSELLGDRVEVTLIDRNDTFVFGFSKLDVMFGRTTPDAVRHPYARIVKPGVTFVKASVTSIDPARRVVDTSAGTFSADVLVVALGADYDVTATPGLDTAGHEFYSVAGAFAARDVLAGFGGGRVVIGVCGSPFKCPPAPSETALMVHDLLVARGLRDTSSVALVMPLPAPVPPSPEASKVILQSFAERGIEFHPNTAISHLDGERSVAVDSGGGEIPFDLFLGVPKHVAPRVLVDSGLTEDGWVPVDYFSLETRFSNVYAVGDCTSVGTPKAGVFAEGQASVVASRIAAQLGTGEALDYQGKAGCFVEFGHEEVARVDIQFLKGQAPHGELHGPSADLAGDKASFGASRVRRWFDREWMAL
jgi:sulfide:quinone oxidoreductase